MEAEFVTASYVHWRNHQRRHSQLRDHSPEVYEAV
ncbi:IS3 family transposase [Corynebacterium sp. TAE3-ERU12]